MPDHDTLRHLVEKGIRASNPTNIQSWRFVAVDDNRELHVKLDEGRLGVAHIDPVQKAHYVGLGAAIENIVIASIVRGYAPRITYFPNERENHHCATLRFEQETKTCVKAMEKFETLYEAIDRRHSNRHLLKKTPVPESVLSELSLVAGAEKGFRLHVQTRPDVLKQFGNLVVMAETVRQEMPNHQKEIFERWLRFSREEAEEKKDGIWIGEFTDIPAFVSKAYLHPTNMKLFSALRFTKIIGHVVRGGLVRNVTTACLLTTDVDDPLHWLMGGRIWQRISLVATAMGVLNQPYNCLLELSDIFKLKESTDELLQRHHKKFNQGPKNTFQEGLETFFGLTGEWCPLMCFAVGYGTEAKFRSYRRSVDDVLEIS